ncbi:MAG: VOC family protein [Chthoniobacter sp.]|nr:VOC family protein [Chthoniobacter sp.]
MSTPDSSCDEPTRKPTPNAIEWNELITPDPDAATRFYGGLFGWTTEVMSMPGMDYTMMKLGDRAFGGVMAPPKPGIPAHWLNYISTTDLDATVAKATSLGATICAGPMDIGDAGRIAILTDPQGAVFGLHQHPAK